MNSADPLPSFLIIGAAKSGTTSLFYYLKQHPQIFFPHTKELNYFSLEPSDSASPTRPGRGPGDEYATEWTYTREAYLSHFRGVRKDQVAGEASVSYLYGPHSAANIQRCNPEMKLIAVLRNPVDRAWSQYLHMVRDGREGLSFERALEEEPTRIARGWEFAWHYRNVGRYGEQLRRFYEHFPKSQLRVYRFEDLQRDPQALLHDVLDFLSLPVIPFNTEVQHNQSGEVKSRFMARLMNRPTRLRTALRKALPGGLAHAVMDTVRRANLKAGKPLVPEAVREELGTSYADDIRLAQKLTGLALEGWLR